MSKQSILLRTKKKKALASFEAGRYDEAWSLYQAICQADRLDAEAWLACGVIAGLRGDHAVAESCCRHALAVQPQLAGAHYNLGIALRSQKKYSEACESFRRATELRARYSEAMEALAHAYISLYDWASAARILEEIIAIWPSKAEIRNNLGTVYQAMGRSKDSIAAYESALKINPRLPGTLNSLGSAYLGRREFEQAERCFRQCLAATPGDLRARSNLLMLLNYLPNREASEVTAEHLEWGRIAQSKIPMMSPRGRCPPGTRLRIAYLSSDFREHSVASFIEPVLRHHDRSRFEVCCYSDLPTPDDTTRRIRASVDLWRDIDQLSDSDAANLICADGIDILVDLAGHTGNNRLGVFAGKPAPLQVTYLGYPNTTGLQTIDYRITDEVADPVGEEAYHSERLLRLAGSFLCYGPPLNAPDVASLPALANGYITFGSFNNLSKVNDTVLAVWAEILKRVARSRLLLKCPALTDASTRETVYASLARLGIAEERVELLGHTATREEHLALYARVDVALDTFPYNGTTTTCEALWMGVPVLSLVSQRHAGRVGASLLSAAGLKDWVAGTPDSFVAAAVQKVADVDVLSALRQSLRQQVATSQLCDPNGFTQRLEKAIVDAWGRQRHEAS